MRRALYGQVHNHRRIMLRRTIHISLESLQARGLYPLTRDGALALAAEASGAEAQPVTILVDGADDPDGYPIHLAEVGARRAPTGAWVLELVSYPRWNDVTAGIKMDQEDLLAFVETHRAGLGAVKVQAESAEAMEAEGLGPLVALDLRPGNPYPTVPTNSDLSKLLALLAQEAQPPQAAQ